MNTFRITSWTTSASHPDETAVSLDVLSTSPSGIVRRYPYDLMVPGRFDTPGSGLDAAVMGILVAEGLIEPPTEAPV